MHEFVNFNCQIFPAEKSCLAATSSAALYGKGIFTTVAIYNFKPFRWEKHWARLTADARKIGIDLASFTEQTIKNSLLDIIEKNDFRAGRARLTFFDESPTAVWQTDSKHKTSFTIQTADFREIKNNFKLTVSPFRVNSTSPLANVKSCNYLENIIAFEDAKAKILTKQCCSTNEEKSFRRVWQIYFGSEKTRSTRRALKPAVWKERRVSLFWKTLSSKKKRLN